MKKLLIVDGNSILNRAFYGIRPLTTKDGLPTNAVYGFITILKKHLDALSPDYLACAFDLKAPTFRHKMYDGYKATRKPMPEDLAAQLPYAKKTASAMGFTVVECEGWEADDVLGTVAGMADKTGEIQSYILTGDRDSLQLITDTTSVILVKTKEDIIYTPEKFKEEYGITPEQFIDVKALMGDSSDNIPGVPGIGEKTALKLIIADGGLDGLYADETLGGAGKSAAEKLRTGKDSAYMSYDLAKISREAPIGMSLEDIKNDGSDNEVLSELFTRLEFSALAKRFNLTGEGKVTAVQIPGVTTVPEKLKKPYAVELCGENLYISDGEGIYKAEISPKFFDEEVICHDYKKLCKELKNKNIEPRCAFDTMTASYLLSPGESAYPIDKSVVRYLSEQPSQGEGSGA
ncbi:MAG: 5'-3' exonuclease H3TH domain-containing protein, partial [Clostridia bacterium]|nr:5'-3' exonuclease H3TH domain-containing protein [Clostridia bacterium]